jgi:hypothetical protein
MIRSANYSTSSRCWAQMKVVNHVCAGIRGRPTARCGEVARSGRVSSALCLSRGLPTAETGGSLAEGSCPEVLFEEIYH